MHKIGKTTFEPGVGDPFVAHSYRIPLNIQDLETQQRFDIEEEFFIADLNKVSCILGLPFMAAHEVHLTFPKNKVTAHAEIQGQAITLVRAEDYAEDETKELLSSLLDVGDNEEIFAAVIQQEPPDYIRKLDPPEVGRKTKHATRGSRISLAPTPNEASELCAPLFTDTYRAPEPEISRKDMHGMRPMALQDDQKQRLADILTKHETVFKPYDEVPPERVPGEAFKVKLKPGAVPESRPGPRLSADKLKGAKAIIDKLIANNFLVESEAPWGSPMLVVYKHDQSGKISGYRAV